MLSRNSIRLMLAVGTAVSLMPAVALADVRSDFEARYAQLRKAMDTREPEQIKPLLTPDFSATDIGGESQSADDLIDRLSMIPVDPERKETNAIDSIEVQGNTAQVVQHLDVSGTREGRDGKTHTMTFATVSHDTWVQQPSGWLLKATEMEQVRITRDGQVLRQMKKGDPIPEGGWRRGRRGPGDRQGDHGAGKGMGSTPTDSPPGSDMPQPPAGDD